MRCSAGADMKHDQRLLLKPTTLNIEEWALSSIGLCLFNPTSQLKCTDITAFCMQLRNSEGR